MELLKSIAGGATGFLAISLYILIGVGDLYWLWMSIQIGSFMMFVAGIVPMFFVVTGPAGAWSLLFGPPDWIFDIFG